MRRIAPWALVMIAWPMTLALLPMQDPLIQLVGLRGQVFFLPFLLIGAMFDDEELRKLAFWLAALNIIVFGFACGEYFLGIARFLPRNAATAVIYISKDVAIGNDYAYRIPATFVNPAGYGGVMVLSLPLLIGAWARAQEYTWNRVFFAVGIAVAVLGVFMCASRSQALIMIVLFVVVSLSFRVRVTAYLAWAVIGLAVGWLVVSSPRLQRFTSLQDTSYVQERIQGSVNEGFFTASGGLSAGQWARQRRNQHPLLSARPPAKLDNHRERIRAHNDGARCPGFGHLDCLYFLGFHPRSAAQIGSMVYRPSPGVRHHLMYPRDRDDWTGIADLGTRLGNASVSNRLGRGSEFTAGAGHRSVGAGGCT